MTIRSLTRLESELAHRLALGMALAHRDPEHRLRGEGSQRERGRLVLEEARRLVRRYASMTDENLADHVTMYALPADYTWIPGVDGRDHAPDCPAVDGYDSCACDR